MARYTWWKWASMQNWNCIMPIKTETINTEKYPISSLWKRYIWARQFRRRKFKASTKKPCFCNHCRIQIWSRAFIHSLTKNSFMSSARANRNFIQKTEWSFAFWWSIPAKAICRTTLKSIRGKSSTSAKHKYGMWANKLMKGWATCITRRSYIEISNLKIYFSWAMALSR